MFPRRFLNRLLKIPLKKLLMKLLVGAVHHRGAETHMQMPNVCENVMSDSNDDSFYLCSYRNTWAILYFYIVIFLLMLFFLRQCPAAMNAHSSLRMVLVFL